MRYLKRSGSLIAISSSVFLVACASESKYDELQTSYNDLKAQNEQLQSQNAAMNQQIGSLNQEVGRLQGAIKYTVNSDLLFAPGSWQMSASGQQVIAKLASQLTPSQRRHIVVNGYTDNAPIGPSLQQAGVTTNEMLSQKRAEAVMEFLVSQGVKPDLVTAKGWGEAQPVAPNDTPAGRSQNRRVELTLAPTGSGA